VQLTLDAKGRHPEEAQTAAMRAAPIARAPVGVIVSAAILGFCEAIPGNRSTRRR
jgi:hypothetical protein